MIANTLGSVSEESDYFPYGGEIVVSGSTVNRYKFTGKERDAESGLDNFGARYDSSSLGRFMTPDWAARPTAIPYAVFGDPQSLNLYGYVRNDPVSRSDADGHTELDANQRPETGASGTGAGAKPLNPNQAAAESNKEPAKAHNQSQTQTQQKPGEEHRGEPISLQPEGSTPAGNGSKIFTYQVVDPSGRPVGDVSVQEHVNVVAAENVQDIANPNPVHYPTGQVRDQVGSSTPPGTGHSFLKTEQTFTAMKDGKTYYMTTKTNQYVSITNGVRTVQVVILVP